MKEGEIGLVNRCSVYRSESPNVRSRKEEFFEGSERRIRYIYETPVGEVSDLLEPCALSGASTVLRRRKVSNDPLLSGSP